MLLNVQRQKFQEELRSFGIKWCSVCDEILDLNNFTFVEKRNCYSDRCKKCKSKWMREDRVKNNDKYRFQDLKQNYGITPTQYHAMFLDQNGVCAICKKPEPKKRGWLHVDHCHRTGEVRGLLCGNCNTGIGWLGEDIKVLKASIEYLRRVQG